MIRLVEVGKTFPGSDRPAVDSLSLEVGEGEFVALVGPSGCGKTTTLKMINRIIEPTSGEIWLDGTEVRSVPAPELRRSIGYVIQQIGLFPHRTVAENIATVPDLLGWDDAHIRRRVGELTELVGLDPSLLGRYPAELSGGQQQRVGVARALAADPPVLLMDEPFGAVDPIVRARLQDEFIALQETIAKTVVFVTHDVDEAIRMADRVAILDVGGILRQYDTPDRLLSDPADEFVASFLGEDRGIKRLSLIRLADIELPPGPTVDVADPPAQARQVMERHGVDWVAVLAGRRLLGWVWGWEVEGLATVGEASPRSFAVTIDRGATLRHALDAIVNTRNNVGVVVDSDGYAGMLTLEDLSRELIG